MDYSSEGGDADRGDGVVAIVGGTINNLRIGNAGYKYILVNGTIHDFGYGHLFSSGGGFQKSGNFYIKLIDGGNANLSEYALITEDGTLALYDNGIETVTHPITGVTITTTSVITAGSTVGPIGTSIGSTSAGHVSAHLHLYLFENNNFSLSDLDTKNPLSVVDHQMPFYNVSIEQMNEVTHNHSHGSNPPVFHDWRRFAPIATGINLAYPGTEETNILVKATADNVQNGNTYNNVVFNIEKFEVLIRSVDYMTSEYLIKGPYYDSKIVYDGAINQNTRYPTNLHANAFGEANENETGIECWAYSDRRQRPWDYYNFGDFVTRIHKDDNSSIANIPTIITDIPQNARYNDGEFIINGQVTDIDGVQYNSIDLTLTLDNYQPFLDGIGFVHNNTFRYYLNRKQLDYSGMNDGYIVNLHSYNDIAAMSNQPYELVVFVSEPMQSITIDYRLEGSPSWTSGGNMSLDVSNPLRYTWQGSALADGCYEFRFQGQDKSNNPLINVYQMTGQNNTYDLASIPVRMSATQWANED